LPAAKPQRELCSLARSNIVPKKSPILKLGHYRRFILTHKLDEICYTAADTFSRIQRNYDRAAGINVSSLSGMRQYNVAIDIGIATAERRDPERASSLGAQIAVIESQLRRVSATGFERMRDLCVFGIEPPPGTEADVTTCLEELARITANGARPAKARIRHWHDPAPIEATEGTGN
jgi:hypothetical protein